MKKTTPKTTPKKKPKLPAGRSARAARATQPAKKTLAAVRQAQLEKKPAMWWNKKATKRAAARQVATPRPKVRQPRPTNFGKWCQVRISSALAAAVAHLPSGVKSETVRQALHVACMEAGIPVQTPADPSQLALPIAAPTTARVLHTDGTLGAAHPIGVGDAKRRPLPKLKPVTKARRRKAAK